MFDYGLVGKNARFRRIVYTEFEGLFKRESCVLEFFRRNTTTTST